MVELIKPSELDPATTVYDDDAMVVDNDGVVQKATPVQVVNAGAPVPTENEAIAGADNTKRMTALRVRQVLDNEVAPAVLRAQAWAESATAPDPLDQTSKSSKTWAAEAAISEQEAQDHADSAAGFAGDALAIKNQLLNDLQADATTLAAGVPATATYDPATLTVSFGIPTGPQGATGPQGPKGDTGDTGPQGPAGTTDWNALTNKPAVIAAGATSSDARDEIDALAKSGDTGAGGYTSAVQAIGNSSGQTITPSPTATSNFKTLTNNGAFTLAAPTVSGAYTISILVTNNATGAGAMTATGFGKVTGSFKTTANLKQILTIEVFDSVKVLTIRDAS